MRLCKLHAVVKQEHYAQKVMLYVLNVGTNIILANANMKVRAGQEFGHG